MHKKLVILVTLTIGFFLSISCLSQGKENVTESEKPVLEQNLPKLLSPKQMDLLDQVSKITLFEMVDSEYKGVQKSKKKKVLSDQEKAQLLHILTKASKDTTLTIDTTASDAFQLVIEGKEDFLTLAIDVGFKQIKIGDVRHGVNISRANDELFNTIKTIVAND